MYIDQTREALKGIRAHTRVKVASSKRREKSYIFIDYSQSAAFAARTQPVQQRRFAPSIHLVYTPYPHAASWYAYATTSKTSKAPPLSCFAKTPPA